MIKLIISIKINLIKFYQYFISPIFGNKCRYFPTCSEYYKDSLKTHGLARGTILGVKRILSCHPFKILGGGEGLDFVPNKKNFKKGKLNG